jgi:curved DNA-binding protein CbpA
MVDPYQILGISPASDDEAIRGRYLELVRQFSPERNPEKFAEIRNAYEQLRDLKTRLRYRLFEAGRNETIDGIIEEIICQSPRQPIRMQALWAMLKKS